MALTCHSPMKVITSCSSLSCTRLVQAASLHAFISLPASCASKIRCTSANNAICRLPLGHQRQPDISGGGATFAAGRQGAGGATEASMLPDSREEAIAQACAAVAANLPAIKSQSKGKKKAAPASAPGFAGETKKISVEIPVADESQDAAVALAKDVIAGLPSPWPSQFTFIVPNSSNTSSNANIVSLDACLQDESDSLLGSCIVIVAPKTNQVSDVEQLLGRWRGSVCILLNAEWAPLAAEEDLGGIDSVHTAFVRSFKAVYCFMPLLIKAFVVSTQEGAVYRCVGAGSGGKAKSGFSSGGDDGQVTGDAWRIFMRQNNSWEPVARMQRRPSSTDVEVSFYNASAANSPLTAGAKFLKGLVNKKK